MLLFGWFRSKPQNVLKYYNKLYEDLKYVTKAFTLPKEMVEFEQIKARGWVYRNIILFLKTFIQINNNLSEFPIVIHCFSNGGAFILAILLQILSENQSKYKILKNFKFRKFIQKFLAISNIKKRFFIIEIVRNLYLIQHRLVHFRFQEESNIHLIFIFT